MSRKVVAYVRVSTEEQARHGYSIEVQEQVLRDYAQGHELEIVESFVESESAYKPGRPLFAEMVKYIEGHKPVTAVLCYKIDRISRNMSDYSYLVEKLGVEILSATEQLPSNATGRLMGDMQAAFSRYFSAQLSERVKTTMAAKAKKGLYPSLAPLGYRNDPLTRTIVPDLQTAPLLRELFETYANTDISLSSLVPWARERGLGSKPGNPLRKSTLHKLLINSIYVGVVRWGEVTAKGQHEPIIPQYLFDRVQEKLHGRGHIQGKHEFPFRGLFTCGYCGCQITASIIKGRYIYYHCTHGRGHCLQPYIRQEALSGRLRSIVDNVRVPEVSWPSFSRRFATEKRSGRSRSAQSFSNSRSRPPNSSAAAMPTSTSWMAFSPKIAGESWRLTGQSKPVASNRTPSIWRVRSQDPERMTQERLSNSWRWLLRSSPNNPTRSRQERCAFWFRTAPSGGRT